MRYELGVSNTHSSSKAPGFIALASEQKNTAVMLNTLLARTALAG